MLAARRSGEIQTRKDDSCRGRTIKSLFWQITTNQRQHGLLSYIHTLPYRHQRSKVRISGGPGRDQAKGHHLQRMACPQERMPTWTIRLLKLQMRPSTRTRSNPQKRQNPHPKATKEASTRCNPSCTPRRNEVHSASKRSGLLVWDQQWHQGNGKGLRNMQQASASTSQIANIATRTSY